MSTAVGDTLPLAIAVAVSPIPLIAIVLILLSRQAGSNGLAFLLGWIVGLAVAEGIVLLLVSLLNSAPGSGPSTIVAALKLIVGAALLLLGIRQWRSLVGTRREPSVPGWMSSIETFTPARAFGLATVLSAVGNIAVIVAAGLTIGRAKLGVGQEVGAVAIFVVLGSLTVAAAVIYQFTGGEGASKALESLKTWLLANNALLTSILFVIVGVLLMGKGLSGLGILG